MAPPMDAERAPNPNSSRLSAFALPTKQQNASTMTFVRTETFTGPAPPSCPTPQAAARQMPRAARRPASIMHLSRQSLEACSSDLVLETPSASPTYRLGPLGRVAPRASSARAGRRSSGKRRARVRSRASLYWSSCCGGPSKGGRVVKSTRAGVVLVLLVSGLASADTIALKNGRRIEGRILHRSPSAVTVEVPGGQMDLPRSQIASIEEGLSVDDEYAQRYQKLDASDPDALDSLASW